jgi:hypothetical protein
MTNPYYNGGAFPATGAPATSASMRAELLSISNGFDKLPTLSGNGTKLVAVNSSGTALEAVSVLPPLTITDSSLVVEDNADSTRKFRFEASGITAGATRVLTVPDANMTIVGLDVSQTLTNKTINLASNTLIATSAQLAAAVTDETGSGSLVFGTSPTLSAPTLSGAVTLSAGTATGVAYLNGSKVLTSGGALTFDGTNFGIGTSSPSNKLVVSNAGAQGFEFDPATGIMQVYNRSTSAYGELRPYGSLIRFFTGTSPTETMRLELGNLLLGTTSTGADGLGISNLLNLTFPEGSGTSYTNLFRQASSAATILANGYKRSANANAFASSVGTSWAKSAIALNTGDIAFYADPAGTVANGTDVTPTERFRVKSTGQARFVPLSADPSGAENGDVYYNSTTNKLRVRAGGAWVDLH